MRGNPKGKLKTIPWPGFLSKVIKTRFVQFECLFHETGVMTWQITYTAESSLEGTRHTKSHQLLTHTDDSLLAQTHFVKLNNPTLLMKRVCCIIIFGKPLEMFPIETYWDSFYGFIAVLQRNYLGLPEMLPTSSLLSSRHWHLYNHYLYYENLF